MRSILSLAVCCLLLFGKAHAEPTTLSQTPIFNHINSINVELDDQVSNGCWTNLKEVREYAEEKLRGMRLNVVDFDGEYTLRIFAFGQRYQFCHAYVALQFVTEMYTRDKITARASILGSGGLVYSGVNLNTEILDQVQSVLK